MNSDALKIDRTKFNFPCFHASTAVEHRLQYLRNQPNPCGILAQVTQEHIRTHRCTGVLSRRHAISVSVAPRRGNKASLAQPLPRALGTLSPVLIYSLVLCGIRALTSSKDVMGFERETAVKPLSSAMSLMYTATSSTLLCIMSLPLLADKVSLVI